MVNMKYEYWLFQIKGLGNRKKIKLVMELGSARTVYESSIINLQSVTIVKDDNSGQMSYRQLLTTNNIEEIERAKVHIDLNEYEKLEEKGIFFTAIDQLDYPSRLLKIPDPPYGILYIGMLPSVTHKSLAIVGARMCSEYGKYIAKEFATYLATNHIQIISGMARGIDGISQKSALESGGYSCAVLGCAVDVCYPAEHRDLYNELKTKGCLLSEFPLGTAPKAQLFPVRNRIISGLSEAILVVEAKQKSGTLITVDQALEQGRDVYAVPGKIVDSLSYGCNYLIKQGATAVLSPRDLYEELCNGIYSLHNMEMNTQEIKSFTFLQKKILDSVDGSPISLELLCQMFKELELTQLQHELMELVLSGDVKQVAGNYYQKIYH